MTFKQKHPRTGGHSRIAPCLVCLCVPAPRSAHCVDTKSHGTLRRAGLAGQAQEGPATPFSVNVCASNRFGDMRFRHQKYRLLGQRAGEEGQSIEHKNQVQLAQVSA